MANETTTTENIDLIVDGRQLDPLFNSINLRLTEINKKILKIGESAQSGTTATFNKINQQLKQVQQALRAVETTKKILENNAKNTLESALNSGQIRALRNTASARLGEIRQNTSASRGELAEAATLKRQIAAIDAELKARTRAFQQMQAFRDRENSEQTKQLKQQEASYKNLERLERESAKQRSQISKGFHQKELSEERSFTKAMEAEGNRLVAAQEKQALDRYAAQAKAQREARKNIIATARAQAVLDARASFAAGTSNQSLVDSKVLEGRILTQLADPKVSGERRQILIAGLNAEQAKQRELNALRAKENTLLNQKLQTQKNIIAAEVARDTAARNSAAIDDLRSKAKRRLLEYQNQLNHATTVEEARLNRLIKLEQQRVTELGKAAAQRLREEKAAARQARDEEKAAALLLPPAEGKSGISGRRSVSNILSPGYAAAAFARTSVYGAAAAGAYGIFDTVRGGLTFIGDLEDGLGKLQAITGSTDTQMKRLSETILAVSRSSRFATTELVESATVLAQAGLSTKEIAQALKSVSQLASASGSSLQQTTDVVTSALGAFQLGADQTARVADVLAISLNNSKLNLEQVALGLQYAGQTAKENNITFEQLVATLATMSQAGIRSGSTQGTGLRQFLTDLQTPTSKLAKELNRLGIGFDEIDVKTRGLPQVLQTLASKGFDASSAYETLEVRAAAAYLVLKNNTDEIYRQTIAQQQWGAAQESSGKAMNTLTAQWQRFKNNLGADVSDQTSGILGSLVSLLKQQNDEMERQVALQGELNRLRPGENLRDFLDKTSNLNLILGALNGRYAEAKELWDIRRSLYNTAEGMDEAQKESEAFSASLERTRTAIADTDSEIQSSQTTIKSIDEAIGSLRLRQDQLKDGSLALKAETASLTMRFEGFGIQLAGTINTVDQLVGALGRLRAAQATTLQNLYFQQYAQQAELANTAFRNMDRGAEGMEAAGLGGFFQQHFGNIMRGVNPNAGQADIERMNTSREFLRQVRANMQRKNPNNPLIQRIDTFLGQAGIAGSARQAQKRLDDQYTAQSFLNDNPVGRKLQADVLRARGGTNKQKQDQLQRLESIASSSKNNAERLAAQQLWVELQSSLTPTEIRSPEQKSGGQSAQRAANRAARNETFVTRDLVSLVDDELKSALDDAKDASSEDLYRAAVSNARGLLEEWSSATRKLAEDEIAQKQMSPELARRYREQTERTIAEKRASVEESVVDSFIASVNTQVELIEKESARLIEDTEGVVKILEARLKGYDAYSLRGRVTDADKIVAEARIRREQENADRSRYTVLAGTEFSYKSKINKVEKEAGIASAALALNPDNEDAKASLAKLNEDLEKLKDKLNAVTREKQALNAAFEAGKDLPVTFRERLDTAVEAYIEANNLTRTFSDEIGQGLLGTIGEAHTAFTGFFTDIATGTRSVGAAFSNMALSVLKALNQMVAQAAANQIFGLLLGLVSPAAGKAAGLPAYAGARGYYGGLAQDLKGYMGGGLVTNGSQGYDSVYAKLRKNEFVVQPGAVESVGIDFMNKLNKQGAQALKGIESPGILAMKPPTPVNVYVVSPEHKQQMGPNDVLAVIADDVLRDGVTKKLIRSVAAGG